eukprot:m.458319 g.458319  ORF g.458319 m.458319 type:complete len:306 (+) comp21582_c0_seq11:127-1044(+)
MKPANTNGGGLPTMVADMAVTERFEETHFRDQQRIKTLFRLVAQGDKEGIANMVRNRGSGRVVRQQDFAGWSCLHTAAYHGKAAVISVLIDAGASVDTKSIVGRTALHYAADQGNGKTVAQLLIAGSSPHTQDHNGHTALHLAAACSSSSAALCVHHLVKVPGNPGSPGNSTSEGNSSTEYDRRVLATSDPRGRSPLRIAVDAGNAHAAAALIKCGANRSDVGDGRSLDDVASTTFIVMVDGLLRPPTPPIAEPSADCKVVKRKKRGKKSKTSKKGKPKARKAKTKGTSRSSLKTPQKGFGKAIA